jgi:hypothetical protein
MSAKEQVLDIIESLRRHVKMVRPFLPKHAVISVGNYASDLLNNKPVFDYATGEFTIFVRKKNENNCKQKHSSGEEVNVVDIEEKADTHYWFGVQKYVSEKDAVFEKIENKPLDELRGAVLVASTGEGVGSGLLPDLVSLFRDRNISTVSFAILPSVLQPADAHFNSLWSMATCCQMGFTQILVDRDSLEDYVGVNRKGEVLKGSSIFGYIMDILSSKPSFVHEFDELTKAYHLKMFTVLSSTGASLKIYGSLKNVLDAALLRPLSKFDLSTASMLYVLVRVPLGLREKFPRAKIDLAVNEWFKEKTSLKAAFASEPIYIDDGNDRVDIVLFVGSFDLSERVASLNAKVKDIVGFSVKKGFVKEKEWRELVDQLVS